MFDYVEYEAPCFECNTPMNYFQSKDGNCAFETLQPEKVKRFYANCHFCGAWNEYRVKSSQIVIERIANDDEEI
jgi:hypothetical protein